MVPPFFRIDRFVDPRMRYIEPNTFPEGTWYCVCRMYPAICIQYLFWNVFAVDTVDGVANVLFGRYNQTEGEHARCGDRVMQPEIIEYKIDDLEIFQ